MKNYKNYPQGFLLPGVRCPKTASHRALKDFISDNFDMLKYSEKLGISKDGSVGNKDIEVKDACGRLKKKLLHKT